MKKMVFAAVLFSALLPSGLAARSYHYRSHSRSAYDTLNSDYYTAASGDQVHRPVQADRAPAGASARCYDGTYSFSESRRGTCSHHGGVASWL